MDVKKNNISHIDKYLKGQLDSKAMYRLERDAQDDPFLMDALEGFEKAGTAQQANLAALEAMLNKRSAGGKVRGILLYRVLPIAACLLITIGAGYWFVKKQPENIQYANVVPPGKITEKVSGVITAGPKKSKAANILAATQQQAPAKNTIPHSSDATNSFTTARNGKKRIIINDPANNVDRIIADTDKDIINAGNTAVVAKATGKDLAGSDLKQVDKNLLNNAAEQTQVPNDYGYQAAKAGKIAAVADNIVTPALPSPKVGRQLEERQIGGVDLLLMEKATGTHSGTEGPLTRRLLQSKTLAQATNKTISGVVLDATTKEPLTGAVIGTDEDGEMVAADINGRFKVTVPDDVKELKVSFNSYAAQTVKLNGDKDLMVNLNIDKRAAADVVIRGYAKIKDNGSGFIAGRDAEDHPIANVDQLLQGKTSGLNIKNATGAPGIRGTVNISGISPVNPNTDPSKSTYTLMGTVTDSSDGQPIMGAVLSFGGDWTMNTNAKGGFETINIGPTILSVNMPGYLPQYIKVNKNDTLSVALQRSYIPYCKENADFKINFFKSIFIAEKFITGYNGGRKVTITPTDFNKAIRFIAHYTEVSIGTRAKARYASLNSFIDDKVKWLNWYEANKCKGIK